MRDRIRKHSKTIGIIGACRRSGATYVATSLALAMAKKTERTAYLETHICRCLSCSLRPLVFYEMGLQNGIFPGRFSDFFFMKSIGENTSNRVNLFRGVNWAVRKADSPACLLLPEDIAGEYVIWDDPPLLEAVGDPPPIGVVDEPPPIGAADDPPLPGSADCSLLYGNAGSRGVRAGTRTFSSFGEYELRRDIADKLDLIICIARTETAFAAAGAETVRKCFKRYPAKTKLVYNMISSKASLKAAEKYIGHRGDFFLWKDSAETSGMIDIAAEEMADYILELY